VISEFVEEYDTKLNDFDSLKLKLQHFSNPMNIEVTQKPFSLQMEMCDLQSDPFFQSKK
jgi:hypothetical protein